MNDERAEIQAERVALNAELAEARATVESVQAKIHALESTCRHLRMSFRATPGKPVMHCPDCGYQR